MIVISGLILIQTPGGGRRGVSETVKRPKYSRKTVKPPLNSAKTAIASFHALHISHRFYVTDVGLIIAFAAEKIEN